MQISEVALKSSQLLLIAANCLAGVHPPMRQKAIVHTGKCPCGRMSMRANVRHPFDTAAL